jgi:signal transduction histidine kinase
MTYGYGNKLPLPGHQSNFNGLYCSDSSGYFRFSKVADSLLNPIHEKFLEINASYFVKPKLTDGCWLYSKWQNSTNHQITQYFYIGNFPYSTAILYHHRSKKLEYINLKQYFRNNNYLFSITFPPSEISSLWFYIDGQLKAVPKNIFLLTSSSQQKLKNQIIFQTERGNNTYWYYRLPNYLLFGILLGMIIFSLANLINDLNKVFIYYITYLSFTFLYFFIRYHDNFVINYHFSLLEPFRDITWQGLSYASYFLFAIHFVDYKTKSLLLYRLIVIAIIVILIYLTIDQIFYWNFKYDWRQKSYFLFRIIMAPFALLIIIKAFSVKDQLSRYLATGSLFMVSGAITTMILALFYYPDKNPWINYHMLYMQIGIVLEVLCFSLGLTYKIKLQERDKTLLADQLNKELKNKEIEKLKTIIETQDAERKRVSSELHDDLGSGLSTIRLLSELSLKSNVNSSELKRISDISSDLVESMRQIIWSMNPESSSLSDFLHYVKIYSDEYFEPYHIGVNFNIQENIPTCNLTPIVRKNLFLIIKETLHNIVKHASATQVTIEYQSTDHHHLISIYDNGKGFDMKGNNNQQGNGIKNILKRAGYIDAEVSITSSSIDGTRINIQFKL